MAAPTRLGAFTLREVIATSGAAAVHAAEHHPTGAPAAVKMLRTSHGRLQGLDVFRAEAEAMARLDHPGIVPIYDHGVTTPDPTLPPQPYIVMALARHGALRADQGLDWPAVAALLDRVLGALAHAHARGCVHCDLKPGNILLDGPADDAVPLVADFGLALAYRDTTRQETAGTPAYMAPEQLLQPRDIGPWTDIYALGCVAFHLVCGELPVPGNSPLAQAMAHSQGQRRATVPVLPGVPSAFVPWLDRTLHRDWRRRFRTAAEARAALRAWSAVDAPIRLPDRAATPVDPVAPTLVDQPSPAHVSRRPTAPVALAATAETMTSPTLPFPVDWRGAQATSLRRLTGAGLALFGLRPPPFAGREAERDHLWTALRAVYQTRRPRCVVLRGDAGSGKSRLARWLVHRAEESGIAWSVELRHGSAPTPDHGLAGALERIVHPQGSGDVERVRRLRGAPADGPPDVTDALVVRLCGDGAGPGVGGARRFAVVAGFLEAMAAGRVLLVLVDDAQWGPDALAFTRWLLQADARALVVITARTHEVPAAAGEALARIIDDDRTTALDLSPLAPRDHAHMVERLLPFDPVTAGQLVARTAGDPLLAVQLVGQWIEQGALREGPAGYVVDPAAVDTVPGSLTELWRPRLERVAPTDIDRVALELGAALGERVTARDWAAACDAVGITPPAGLIDRAARAGLVRRTRAGWRFAHALLRDAVRALMSQTRTRQVHAACAQGLSTLDPDQSPAAMARIAEHWQAAGAPAQALGPLRQAAWLRIDRMERDSVRPLVERHDALLDALDAPQDDPRRARSVAVRAYLAFADADLEQTRALFAIARDRVQAAGLETVRARLLRLRGMMARQEGRHAVAGRLLEAAAEQALSVGLIAEAGKAKLGLVAVRQRLGEPGAQALVSEAQALFERAGDRFWLTTALQERARVLRAEGELGSAVALTDRVLAIARAEGDEANTARALHVRANLKRLQRQMAASAEDATAARRIYARSDNINAWLLDVEGALRALMHDRLDEARALAEVVEAHMGQTMWAAAGTSRILILALGAAVDGDPDEADRLIAHFDTLTERPSRSVADAVEIVADAFARLGDANRAAQLAARSAACWRGAGVPARAEAILARLANPSTG